MYVQKSSIDGCATVDPSTLKYVTSGLVVICDEEHNLSLALQILIYLHMFEKVC